ncbi:MAG: DUF4160 domain-containing protein [Synergistaceae bacterium]|nr:DUF4160 domain-containing protein [Synergistaceae bacterium]
MPSISMFFGIIIYMYFDDHKPPHFHAKYQDYEAVFDFDGELLEGAMPGKQLKLISAWAVLHSQELAANWTLAKDRQPLYRIDPLR